MKVTKAKVYGLCEGVKYALNYVKKVKNEVQGDIFLLGNLVHNQTLMNSLKQEGIKILNEGSLEDRINSLTNGTIIFSAHGHDPKLDVIAKNKGLNVKDATCPRVLKNMKDILKVIDLGLPIIYIGIKDHEESNAALSLSNEIIFIDHNNPKYPKIKLDNVHVFNQTTLSVLSLKKIHDMIISLYQNVTIHNDICNATYLRQISLNNIEEDIYYVIILGDSSSSNSKRLQEIAKIKYPNKVVLLFSTLKEVQEYKFDKTKKIFLTAGASTPDEVILPVEKYLLNL